MEGNSNKDNAPQMSSEQKQDELYWLLEQKEFAIALRVAQDGADAVEIQDITSLLINRLNWEKSAFGDRTKNRGEMLAELQTGQLSLESVGLLKTLISNAKKLILIGRKISTREELRQIQEQWFGIKKQPQSTIVGEVFENSMKETANDAVWQPQLVNGLENVYRRIVTQNPSLNADKISPECLSQIESFNKDPGEAVFGIEADFLETGDDLTKIYGTLSDIHDLNILQCLSEHITQTIGSQFRGEIFQSLRAWQTSQTKNSMGTTVVEGRFVTNDENQFAKSEFLIFLVKNQETTGSEVGTHYF